MINEGIQLVGNIRLQMFHFDDGTYMRGITTIWMEEINMNTMSR